MTDFSMEREILKATEMWFQMYFPNNAAAQVVGPIAEAGRLDHTSGSNTPVTEQTPGVSRGKDDRSDTSVAAAPQWPWLHEGCGGEIVADICLKCRYDFAAASLTFADIGLGEEFVDQDGNTWEKRSERRALSWYEGEPPELVEFAPTEPVRLK